MDYAIQFNIFISFKNISVVMTVAVTEIIYAVI